MIRKIENYKIFALLKNLYNTMKKISLLLLTVLSIIACSQKETNLKVSGNIKGLKKGTLYLQMIEDTSLVNVDSLTIKRKVSKGGFIMSSTYR